MEETIRTKYDCSSYKPTGCRILKRRYCDNEICNFYKKSCKVNKYNSGEPTEVHKKLMMRENLNPQNWVIIEESRDAIVIRHKRSWSTKTIQKERK